MLRKIGRPKIKPVPKVRMTVELEKKVHVVFTKELRRKKLSAAQFFRTMVLNLVEGAK